MIARILIFCVVAALLIDIIHEQISGVVGARIPASRFGYAEASKRSAPEQFENIMTYQWYRFVLVVIGCSVYLGIRRRAERTGPNSDDFQGNAALDELSDHLDNECKNRP